MKKTTRTHKLVLDRQTLRSLTNAELAQPIGGWWPDTRRCVTDSCAAACNATICSC